MAKVYCRRRRYRILKRNWFLGRAEIDLLAEAPDRTLVIIEVRGRSGASRLPRHSLSAAKVRKLRWLAGSLARRYRRKIRIELLEVVGELPASPLKSVLLILRPEWVGIRFGVVSV